MFTHWIGHLVTIVHTNPKKSLTGYVVSCSGESLVLNRIFDAEGRPKEGQGQEAFCIRNPLYEKFLCTKSD
jgi:hypothetical protein